jgi:hypothetical protein
MQRGGINMEPVHIEFEEDMPKEMKPYKSRAPQHDSSIFIYYHNY